MYLDLDGWVERDTLGRGRDVRRRLSGDGSTRRCAVLRRLFLLSLAAALVAGACTQGDDAATGETTSTAAAVATTKATPTTVASSTAVDGQSGVVVEKDLVFGSYNGVAMTLDLYLPAEPSGAPIVVEPPFPDDLAEAGAIVVGNVEGVGDPPDADDEGAGFLGDHGAHIRAQAEATACAIRFARGRASELGSDDPVVVVAGLSQPGGLAAHVALFGASLEERWEAFATTVGGPPRQVDCVVTDGSTHVDVLVDTAGTYDLYVPVIEGLYGRSYQQDLDPELQQFLASAVGSNPGLTVRLFHDPADPAIPMTVSEDFEAALADAAYDVQLTSFTGGHNFPPKEISFDVFMEVLDR